MAINPNLVSIIPASELPTATPTSADEFLFYDGDEMMKAPMANIYELVSGSQSLGTITPSSTIPSEGNVWGFAGEGTYPNAGNITVESGKFAILSRVGTTWSKVEIELPSNTAEKVFNPLDDENPSTMKAAAKRWDKANAAIGNYMAAVDKSPMTPPYNAFDVNNGNSLLPSNSYFFQDESLLKDKFITKIKAKVLSLGAKNIYIFKKDDLSLKETIIISATTYIFEYIFPNPIDSDLYYVAFSTGFTYYPYNWSIPTPYINPSGVLSENTTIVLAVEYFTSATIAPPTIVERLHNLEMQTNKFQWENIMLGGDSIYSKVIKESSTSSYTITDGKINITSIGQGNGIVIANNIYLNKRCFEFEIKLGNTSTQLYVGTQPQETPVGETSNKIDFGLKTINDTFSFDGVDVNVDDTYIINMSINDMEETIILTNKRTTQKVQFSFAVPRDIFDRYKIGFISGTGVISALKIFSTLKERPYVMFFGDSITRAWNVPFSGRFPNLIGSFLNKEYLISGRAAGNINGLLDRLKIELPSFRPRYVFITIGTNGLNTIENLNTLIDFCESYDCKVILNRIPLYDGSTNNKNAMIETVVNDRKLLSVRFDIATSINFDGVTKDNTCFTNEAGTFIHPNEKGNLQMFERAKIDVRELFINAGVGI